MRIATFITALTIAAAVARATVAAEQAARPSNPFFALCISTHDPKSRAPADQAKLLKQLGYAGTAHVWLDGVHEAIKAADDNGLELYQIYVRVSLVANKPAYDARLKDVVKSLKGRQTMLGLLIQGKPPSAVEHDPQAVKIVREIAAMAVESGVRIALYPHTGDWLARAEDAVRVADKVDRKNVGVMFNLCHWMRTDKQENLVPVLRKVAPRLFAVSINGADRDNTAELARWIQPLGRGTYDVYPVVKTLTELGYTGPVGLQCYGVKGDVRENLQGSIDTWRKFCERIAAEQPEVPAR
ncbi:MAG: sugar phosphate isomerase/epimerase [Candidatus Nealsonbacteria bacterium]|nr:sugar phosphate isomerase/epimerase [Candidatus Nealsonbacteria bacterium]